MGLAGCERLVAGLKDLWALRSPAMGHSGGLRTHTRHVCVRARGVVRAGWGTCEPRVRRGEGVRTQDGGVHLAIFSGVFGEAGQRGFLDHSK